jgi:hypothetical protein
MRFPRTPNVVTMAVHDHRSSDHHHTAASAVLGAFGEFYDSARAFRCAFLNLASRVRLSELVGCGSSAGAACRDLIRGEFGDVGTYAAGYRSSCLQRHLAEASRPKSIAVIHAHEANATGNRFRDSTLCHVFAREPGDHPLASPSSSSSEMSSVETQ